MAFPASEAKGGATWAVRVASVLALAAAGCDGGQGSGVLCENSVAGYCAQAGDCPRTWTEAQDAPLVCSQGAVWSVPSCGGYHELIIHGIDTGTRYYYDRRTGALVAVVNYGVPFGQMCAAGPGAFLAPSCDESLGGPLTCRAN